MAVTSRAVRSARQPARRTSAFMQRVQALLYGITLLLAVFALYLLIGLLLDRVHVLVDDARYGRPRTSHLSARVGHGDESIRPTHLAAINLDRQIVVIELPGGDPAQVRTFMGPYLVGADEHLTPVTLDLRDVDGDGAADLLVNIRQEQIVYLNRDGEFRSPTPDEHAELLSRGVR